MYRFHDLNRHSFDVFRSAGAPIKILELIGEDKAGGFHLVWKPNFEGIPFRTVCDGDRHD